MPSLKKITIVIDEKGNPNMNLDGFTDGACLKETQDLEEGLGKVTDRTKKPEAYRDSKSGVKIGN